MTAFSTIAFLIGSITSLISGFLGMKIATYANARTALEVQKGISKAFTTAFRDDLEGLFEAITGTDSVVRRWLCSEESVEVCIQCRCGSCREG
ncbi:putative inorganic diphosphatase [Helianthus annuus]|nr:putative inorganic diphosphatase [Helianthus annuus]KAJ0883145.1 putative inorganic diphosphatase [Helianthus annuus]KAJ0941102.1 putative inorganic diphosphatase [Helianthus annuus]